MNTYTGTLQLTQYEPLIKPPSLASTLSRPSQLARKDYSYLPLYSRLALDSYRRVTDTGRETDAEWKAWIEGQGAVVFDEGNTQGYAVGLDEKVIALVFRGTELERVEDLLTDLNTRPQRLACTTRVHKGAFDALGHATDRIFNILEPYRGHQVYLCGHSLGGMKAQLMAFLLFREGFKVGRLVTFGSPPAGNLSFASTLCSVLRGSHARVVHCADVVPRLWPMAFKGYRYANGLVYINRHRQVFSQPEGSVRFIDRSIARLQQRSLLTLGIKHHSMQLYHDILSEKYL